MARRDRRTEVGYKDKWREFAEIINVLRKQSIKSF